jgi:hypothetical protein
MATSDQSDLVAQALDAPKNIKHFGGCDCYLRRVMHVAASRDMEEDLTIWESLRT